MKVILRLMQQGAGSVVLEVKPNTVLIVEKDFFLSINSTIFQFNTLLPIG